MTSFGLGTSIEYEVREADLRRGLLPRRAGVTVPSSMATPAAEVLPSRALEGSASVRWLFPAVGVGFAGLYFAIGSWRLTPGALSHWDIVFQSDSPRVLG